MEEEIEIVVNDALPARSPFGKLKPEGLGSGDVESLWSYLVRLATGHGLTLYGILCRLMPELLGGTRAAAEKTKMEFYQHYCSVRINAPFAAGQLLGRIEHRLPVGCLKPLTELPLSAILNGKSPHHKTRQWCPVCFRTDVVPYDRLSWGWVDVVCCVKHRVRLSNACPSCGAAQRFRGTGPAIDRCERCNATLVSAEHRSDLEPFELHVAETASTLIQMGQHNRLSADSFEMFRTNVRVQWSLAGSSFVLSRMLGFGRNTLHSAYYVRRLPNLQLLAKVAWLGGVSVETLLAEKREFERLAEPAWRSVRSSYKPREPRESDAVLLVLLEMMRKNPYRPITVTALCVASRVCRKHPSFCFPAVRKILAVQRKVATSTRLAISTWAYCELLRKAIRAVEEAGDIPCTSRLNRALEVPGVLRNAGARRMRDGFLRAVRSGRRGVLRDRETPLHLALAAKWSK